MIPCNEWLPGQYRAEDNATVLAEGGEFRYWLYCREQDSEWELLRSEIVTLDGAVGGSRISGAWPNPFSDGTAIRFQLSEPGRACLSIVDAAGRRVTGLIDEPSPAGIQEVRWDGRDASGRLAASGMYFIRLETQDHTEVAKLVLRR
jgi:hypothetical protein